MLAKLYEYLASKYEASRAFVLNPCDYGAHRSLHLLRGMLAHVATDCRCCSGARSLLLAALAAVYPWFALAVIAALMAYGLVQEIRDPQYNYGPESEE